MKEIIDAFMNELEPRIIESGIAFAVNGSRVEIELPPRAKTYIEENYPKILLKRELNDGGIYPINISLDDFYVCLAFSLTLSDALFKIEKSRCLIEKSLDRKVRKIEIVVVDSGCANVLFFLDKGNRK